MLTLQTVGILIVVPKPSLKARVVDLEGRVLKLKVSFKQLSGSITCSSFVTNSVTVSIR